MWHHVRVSVGSWLSGVEYLEDALGDVRSSGEAVRLGGVEVWSVCEESTCVSDRCLGLGREGSTGVAIFSNVKCVTRKGGDYD